MAIEKQFRVNNLAHTFIGLPKVAGHASVTLAPGQGRNFPASYFEALSKGKPGALRAFEMLEKAKRIAVVRPNDPNHAAAIKRPETVIAPHDLAELSSNGAITLVNAEDSADNLRSWLTAERRTEVRAAIQSRILSLAPAPINTGMPPSFGPGNLPGLPPIPGSSE